MSAQDISCLVDTFPRQEIHIRVSTKLCFQATLRRFFGVERLVAINASVEPFIFPLICWQHVHLCALVGKKKEKKKKEKKKKKKKKGKCHISKIQRKPREK